MSEVLDWAQVDRSSWSYGYTNSNVQYIVYKLTKLPDFTDHRFDYLCKEVDQRAIEIVKKQMSMVRQFHTLGSNWGISLRITKQLNKLVVYLVFRCASKDEKSEVALNKATQQIRNSLMDKEYTFEEASIEEINDISWANEACEILKHESEYSGQDYPTGDPGQKFYVSYLWNATDNDMEGVCQALLNHRGNAVLDITIVPTEYLDDEKNWLNTSISRLKECMNGETIKDSNNRIIWQADKLPILKTPLDNFEKLNKKYESSRVFLSSIRLFVDEDITTLANAVLTNCVRNEGIIQSCKKGFKLFQNLERGFHNVDVSAETHTRYWNTNMDIAPFRAQRLSRLNSEDEVCNFFRIPTPIKAGFPGFDFDTGLDGNKGSKEYLSKIKLGSYLDDANKHEDAVFDSQQLAKHGLIVGVPGSGKTTAMFNILYQLWDQPNDKKIPFIILEPAKTEYRALKTLPLFKDDMLVFTLGDEGVSPFRFNPMEVLPGIKIESHISKLQACFVGAFNLFDPLPIFLEQAIYRTYTEKGWYEDSVGGDPGLETPTLSDLCRNAEYIVSHSGFDDKMRSNFNASLLERLNSLRRGSKGRMLDTKYTIPIEDLMNKPVVMELDSLNGDEKSLMMMFLLSYVYEYCKVKRKSGSPLKHMLLVEEAHNLIAAPSGGSSDRADPKAQTIELFVNMLAEMRALGQGILIADQLPTAIAAQAVKQTNVKILMRETAKDDREEIGNTMDLNEEQMHQVVNFKTGHAYLYHEGEDRVRAIRMLNFKGEYHVEEPPADNELKHIMSYYENEHKYLYMPYPECSLNCKICNRRLRNQVETFVHRELLDHNADVYKTFFKNETEEHLKAYKKSIGLCSILLKLSENEMQRIFDRYHFVDDKFTGCVYIHLMNIASHKMKECSRCSKNCSDKSKVEEKFKLYREREVKCQD